MKRVYLAICVLAVMVMAINVSAAPAVDNQWVVPDEGAVEMFRQGDRAFSVGSDGGAGSRAVTEKLLPSPGGEPIADSRCAMNLETCSGSCVAYLHYYCKPADCGGFKFC